jgi:TP901 family phage tail tape measure protein
MKLIASAKPELLELPAALAQTTKEAIALAEASGLTLPDAAKALTTALNQFELSATQSSRVINVLAAGSKFAAAEIPELAASLTEFGGVAKSMNISLEQSAAAVEAISGKIKGARAGIQLRNVFLKLASSADQSLNPAVVGLNQALENLAPIQDDVTALSKMFGVQNVIAAQTLIKERVRVDELTEALTGTNTAYEQAAENTDNLAGDIEGLKSAWEGLMLSMEGTGPLRRIVGLLSDAVLQVSNLDLAFTKFHKQTTDQLARSFDLMLQLNNKQGREFQAIVERTQEMSTLDLMERREGLVAAFAKVPHVKKKEAVALYEELVRRKEQDFMDKFNAAVAQADLIAAEKEDAEDGADGAAGADGEAAVEKVEKVEKQITTITGAAPKTFNINIQSLIETQEINTTTLTESASEVKMAITRAMAEALADVEPMTE